MIVEVPVMLSHTFCMTIKCIITVQLLVEKPPKTSIQVYNKDASGHPHQQKTFYAYLYDKSKNDLHFWCIEKPPKKKQVTLTLPETNKPNLKMHGWNTSYFPGRWYVTFRECRYLFSTSNHGDSCFQGSSECWNRLGWLRLVVPWPDHTITYWLNNLNLRVLHID